MRTEAYICRGLAVLLAAGTVQAEVPGDNPVASYYRGEVSTRQMPQARRHELRFAF